MGLFRRKETRSAEAAGEENKQIIVAEELLAAMRNNDTVTVADALQVPCFASCVSLLSSTVAMLPVKLYREGRGETAEVNDDNRVKLLNDETGDLLDSFQMKAAFIADYLIYGNGYIYIDRYRNNIEGLYYVRAGDVSYSISPDPIFKSAVYMINGKQYEHFRLLSLLRKSKNGVYGTGIFEEGKEALATAYNTKVFQHYSVLNGGNKSGFLQSKSKLTEPAMDVLKEKWKLFRNNKNKEPMVLNDGLEFKETTATSVEMQLNENIQTNNEEICLLFGLAPDVISGKATAEQFANAVRTAVQPILESLQCALNRNLLLESEKGKMYFAFDTTELLKGDMLKRYQAYQIALQSNFMQIDEVRYKEDLPKLGFNYVKLGLQDVLLDVKSGTVYTPNTNQTAKIGAEVLKSGVDSGIIKEEEEQRFNPNHDPKNGRFTSGGISAQSVDFSGKSDIINSGSDKMTISAIENPIEQKHTGKGNPNAILHFDIELNNRQSKILEQLPEYDSRVIVSKNEVSMMDLSALTAKTGDEFAMFTKGNERLIIRGDSIMVNIGIDEATKLASDGYKWSGHTHPGIERYCLQASAGDMKILRCFKQETSVIYNSKGNFQTFEKG